VLNYKSTEKLFSGTLAAKEKDMAKLVVHGESGRNSGNFGRVMFEEALRAGATHFQLSGSRLLIKVEDERVRIAYHQYWKNPVAGNPFPIDAWVENRVGLAYFRQALHQHKFVRRAWELSRFGQETNQYGWQGRMFPPPGAITVYSWERGLIPREILAWWDPPNTE